MATHDQQATPAHSSTCRFLGLQDDPQTSFAFPSDWNTCHLCKPVVVVSLIHQEDYCLTPKHRTCPVFVRGEPGSLPRELRNRRQLQSGPGRLVWTVILVTVLLAALVTLGIRFAPQLETFLTPAAFVLSDESATQPVRSLPVLASVEDTPSPIPTLSPTPIFPVISATFASVDSSLTSSTPTGPDVINATPTITRIPRELESLIGINHLFKIHRVQQGDKLASLAFKYGTSIAAISAVNYHFTTPLWVGQIIIIPVNREDVSDLPPFEAYRVQEDTDLENLASQLDVDLEGLRDYNGLETSNQVSAGEWLIVPRAAEPAE